ncbi:MAG: hypothetical protein P8Y02_07370, partial [Deinococcales bacterium]
GVTATLDHLTIEGGTFIASGAGIRNSGTLTVSNSTIRNNRAWYVGGGIYNESNASLTLENSAIENNEALVLDPENGATFDIRDLGSLITVSDGGDGGGLYNDVDGTVTVDGTTFDGNMSKYSGGGIYNDGAMTLASSPISDNTADYTGYLHVARTVYGGGAYNGGSFDFSDEDFTGNTTVDIGGGFAILQNATGSLDTVFFGRNHADYGGGFYHEYCTDKSNLTLASITFGTGVDANTADTLGPNFIEEDACATPVRGLSINPTSTRPYPDPATLR